MKKLKGKITISRPTGNDDNPHLSITVIDSVAGVEAIEIRMGLAEFTEALTGMGRVECDFEWNESGCVGKVRETKTVPVFVPRIYWREETDLQSVRKALAVHEVDGWHGSVSDATNHHRRMSLKMPANHEGSWQSVGFERWVDAPPEPAQ